MGTEGQTETEGKTDNQITYTNSSTQLLLPPIGSTQATQHYILHLVN